MGRLLVTGGAGFIGSHFVRHWLERHPADGIVVLDAFTAAGRRERLPASLPESRLLIVRGSIGDHDLVARLLRDEHVSTLVNFAAESSVDSSIRDSRPFLHTNVEGVHCLLEAVRSAQETHEPRIRFHQISTDEVFGEAPDDGSDRNEDGPYAPGSPYSASKAAADHLVQSYARTYGLCCSISYCSNNFGPEQLPDKLVPRMAAAILTGQPIPLYGDGLQERCWLHVEDHCRALEQCLAERFAGRRLFLGSTVSVTNLELARRMARLHGLESPRVFHVEDRPGHDRRYRLSDARFRTLSGFAPRMTLDEGLSATFGWYASQAADSIWRTPIGC